MSRHDEVLAAAEDLLGPVSVLADHSWSNLDLAVVLEVQTEDGRHLIVKGHSQQGHHDVEIGAYHDVVPAIADRAPTVVIADPHRRVLVMTKLDGGAFPSEEDVGTARLRGLYRDAGALLARLHAAAPARPRPDFAERYTIRLEAWIERAPEGLLGAADVDYARRRIAELAHLPAPPAVICHSDWQPRNWLVTRDDRVLAFDFERVRWEWWGHDISRMWWREWVGRPDLAEAFFAGYGRAPTDDDLATLMALSAAGHITQIVWATEHGDEAFAHDGRVNLNSMMAADG